MVKRLIGLFVALVVACSIGSIAIGQWNGPPADPSIIHWQHTYMVKADSFTCANEVVTVRNPNSNYGSDVPLTLSPMAIWAQAKTPFGYEIAYTSGDRDCGNTCVADTVIQNARGVGEANVTQYSVKEPVRLYLKGDIATFACNWTGAGDDTVDVWVGYGLVK